MKVSGRGAAVGAIIGCVARPAVVFLNVVYLNSTAGRGEVDGPPIGVLALPSAAIGLLVGAMAGSVGRPLPGAAVGAILSGVVFELFMCACASLIGSFSQNAGAEFFSQTLIYGLEMAIAGALAGGIGGLVGKATDQVDKPAPSQVPQPGGEGGKDLGPALPENTPAQVSDLAARIRSKQGQE